MIAGRPAIWMHADCVDARSQKNKKELNVCWAEFVEEESGIDKYEVQIRTTTGTGACPIIEKDTH
jgi:hypothetical protein